MDLFGLKGEKSLDSGVLGFSSCKVLIACGLLAAFLSDSSWPKGKTPAGGRGSDFHHCIQYSGLTEITCHVDIIDLIGDR